MGFIRGLVGAGVGALTGGPAGAIAGGVSGLMDNGAEGRTSTQSGNTNSRTNSTVTQRTDLRDQTKQEIGLQGRAGSLLDESYDALGGQGLDRIGTDAYRRSYDSAAQAIGQTYDTRGARRYASAARRGVAGGSASRDNALLDRSSESRELGLARLRAEEQARQAVLMEQENRRANAALAMENLNAMWRNRLIGSSVVKTADTKTTGSATNATVGPDTTGYDIATGLGAAAADPSSPLGRAGNWASNKVNDMFGGL